MKQSSATPRIIKDIKDSDVRIQITGYVKEIDDKNYCILDDKTGTIKVDIRESEFSYKLNDLINVIGELILNTNGEKTLEADIIQNMNKLNFEYYQRLYQLKKEIDI